VWSVAAVRSVVAVWSVVAVEAVDVRLAGPRRAYSSAEGYRYSLCGPRRLAVHVLEATARTMWVDVSASA